MERLGAIGSRIHHRPVAQRASKLREQILPGACLPCYRQLRRRREHAHEIGEAVDIRFSSGGIHHIFRICDEIVLSKQCRVAVGRVFQWEQAIGDTHFVQVRVTCEG